MPVVFPSWCGASSENVCYCDITPLASSDILKPTGSILFELPLIVWLYFLKIQKQPEMWANAQHDGRPAEHRWRPLFNAAKFGWPLLYCCAVTLPRREGRWNLEGCPKLVNRSQPLVRRSLPYCEDMWMTHCCLTSFFFPIVDMCLHCEDIARQSCAMVPRWWFLATFLRPVFSASRVRQVSDLHLKVALRPHHVWKYGRHAICGGWD